MDMPETSAGAILHSFLGQRQELVKADFTHNRSVLQT